MLTDEENRKYGMLTILTGISVLLYLAALIYLLYIIFYSIYYNFQHDTLTAMQIFKMFLKKYIIGFVCYFATQWYMKGVYKSWKELADKKNKSDE